MTAWLLVALFAVTLRAHWKNKRAIETLREELDRLSTRFSVIELGDPADRDVAPEPASELAPSAPARPPGDSAPPALDPDSTASASSPARSSTVAEPLSLPPPGVDPVDSATAWLKERISGVGWTVLVGIVVLFFGLAFLVKYAVDRDLVSVQLRLLAVGAAGVGMVVFGYRTRTERALFGLSLQGGGMGVVYLTVFAAFRVYDLIPAGPAFALLVAFVGVAAALAVAQDSRIFMVLASAGGFLAPFLVSTGSGNHVALFGYYVVLNAGVLAIAWFRAWRVLNLVGFVFTFALSSLWGVLQYRPELFATTEPFLLVFFVMYVAVAVLFALRQTPDLKGLVDGTLVFGAPLAVAALQTPLVSGFEYGLAWSAAGFAAFYVILARAVPRLGGTELRPLSDAFLATGIVFGTLAVFYTFDTSTTSALWAFEGAAIVWVGVRQNRWLPRITGSALQLFAGLLLLTSPDPVAARPLLNATFLGTSVLTISALVSAFQFERARASLTAIETKLHLFHLFLGVAWWMGGCLGEVSRFASGKSQLAWILIVLAIGAMVSRLVGRALEWRNLGLVSLGMLPSAAVVLLFAPISFDHPLDGLAATGWLSILAAHAAVLALGRGGGLARWHAGGLWLGTLLVCWEVSYRVSQLISEPPTWRWIAWGFVPAVVVIVISRLVHHEAYQTLGASPVVVGSLLWVVVANVASDGDPSPLPYVPVLNPLAVVTAIVLVAAVLGYRSRSRWRAVTGVFERRAVRGFGLVGFLWLHAMLLRSISWLADVPFRADALYASTLVQTSVAVLWAVTGLIGMVMGSRYAHRPAWVAGAGLMAAVVAKLFLVDLSHAETVSRIVSFIAVGTLLLAVGYLSPAPPVAVSASEVGPTPGR